MQAFIPPMPRKGGGEILGQIRAIERLNALRLDVDGAARDGLRTPGQRDLVYSVTIDGARLAASLIRNGHTLPKTPSIMHILGQMHGIDRSIFTTETFHNFTEDRFPFPQEPEPAARETGVQFRRRLIDWHIDCSAVYRSTVVKALDDHHGAYTAVHGDLLYSEEAAGSAAMVVEVLGHLATANQMLRLNPDAAAALRAITEAHEGVVTEARVAADQLTLQDLTIHRHLAAVPHAA